MKCKHYLALYTKINSIKTNISVLLYPVVGKSNSRPCLLRIHSFLICYRKFLVNHNMKPAHRNPAHEPNKQIMDCLLTFTYSIVNRSSIVLSSVVTK